jgi:replication-associated recombination protein RarA
MAPSDARSRAASAAQISVTMMPLKPNTAANANMGLVRAAVASVTAAKADSTKGAENKAKRRRNKDAKEQIPIHLQARQRKGVTRSTVQ